jgi:hypothetical protein
MVAFFCLIQFPVQMVSAGQKLLAFLLLLESCNEDLNEIGGSFHHFPKIKRKKKHSNRYLRLIFFFCGQLPPPRKYSEE